MIDISKFFRSLTFAWRGIVILVRREQSFRLQLIAAAGVAVLAFIFPLQRSEIALLLVVTTSVLVLELLNSAVERLVDVFTPRIHQYAEEIKDIMAGAVLVSSVGALLAAVIVFGPHVSRFLNR